MTAQTDAAEQYFSTIAAALAGLEIFMRDDRSPLYRHGIVAKIVASYIGRLEKSFSCWRNRLGFVETFKISRAESGFPVFQNVLELENDRRQANQRLASIPEADEIRNEMADFILRHKEFPAALQTADGRAALSGGRQGRQSVQPVHAGRDGQGLGQSEDLPALLSRALGDLRRQRQPAADLHGDGRGFLRSDGRAAGRRRTASSTTRSTSRCRSTDCSTPSSPTASTISPRRTRPIRCRRRRSPSISTRISSRCIPSSCAASCSGRSIRPASPRTIRR